MTDERAFSVEQVFRAENRNQARYRAYKAFREAWPISFREFLVRGVTVRDLERGQR